MEKFNLSEKGFDQNPPEIILEEFRKVVLSRRSVRVFDDTPVPAEVVNDCIDLALLAPNSSNLQPWEFHWIRSPQKKEMIVQACFSQPAARTAKELIAIVARTRSWPLMTKKMLAHFERQGIKGGATFYYEKLVPHMYQQGPLGLFGFYKKCISFFRGVKKATAREPNSESEMKIWAAKTASLAAENMMLAFRAHGYDTCPMEGFDSARIGKILNLPPDAFVPMIVGIGKRSPKGVYGPRLRFERELFVKEV